MGNQDQWMTQEPKKRRGSKKPEEVAHQAELAQENAPKPLPSGTSVPSANGDSDAFEPAKQIEEREKVKKSGQLTAEEKEECISYVAWWLARNGFFGAEVKLEIARKYNLAGKAAEEIIAAARSRHEAWEQSTIEGRRSLAGSWWISVVHGEDATLAQKMRAMECWQELHGLLRPAAEDKGPITITIIEQVITERSQIHREEDSSTQAKPASIPVAALKPANEKPPGQSSFLGATGEKSDGVR